MQKRIAMSHDPGFTRYIPEKLSTSVLQIAAIVVTLAFGGNVLAQHASCLRGWQFENISLNTNGPLITGTPATITWHQATFGDRDDVWARNGSGGLIHYFRKQGQA